MIGKFNINDKLEVLLYGDSISTEGWPDLHISFIEEVKHPIDAPTLPIFKYEEFLQTLNPMSKRNTRDRVLSTLGIESFKDLSDCYNMVRYKVAPFTKRIRNMIVDKYSELTNYGE